jgi:hypothetical protein
MLKLSPKAPPASGHKMDGYYVPFKVVKWTAGDCPCFTLQLGDRIITAALDLGFVGNVGISEEILEALDEKQFLCTKKMFGAQGHEYEEKLYKLPEVTVKEIGEKGKMTFYQPVVQEEPVKFHEDANLAKGDEPLSYPEEGRIGCSLFENYTEFNRSVIEKIASFKISDVEFGGQMFYPLNIQLPISVEAVLGMPFLRENVIFLDFVNKEIYISPRN